MKCHIYLSDDMMNHITAAYKSADKNGQMVHKVVRLQIRGKEVWTYSNTFHILKRC